MGQLRPVIVKLSILLLAVLSVSSCSFQRKVVVHPIAWSDFIRIPKGTICGEAPTIVDGYFVSETYLEEILNIKVGN